MAEAIVSKAVETLGDLLMKEAHFLSRVKNEVQDMQAELKRMQCFLKDADSRQNDDERVRNWVRSIRNLAYKIEDILEIYAIKVESRKGKGIKKTLKRCACLLDDATNLHKLGVEIGNIKNKIASLTSSLQTYGIQVENIGESSNINEASKNLLRQTFAHEMEEHFVGMKDDVHKLVSLLTVDKDKEYGRIISIFGMGGSGKTTLAKQVFNHMNVQNHFESFAWVVSSQQFNADSLLKQILRQLGENKNDVNRMEYPELVQDRKEVDVDRMEYRELVQGLYTTQIEKKCLIVLDDIWKTEHWEILRPAFPSASKVLLTTRIKDVAQIGIPHKLNLFNEEEGWQLLKKKALTSASDRGHEVEKEYETMGKKMVHKCGYLPLAISVIGGILNKKETLKEWDMVNKGIDSYLRFGEGIEDNHQLMHILNLSYEDLPYQLKPCFMYLAYYPEGASIKLLQLYWMWIAEGMVLSKDQRADETLMEVADRYLTELVSRSLVQVELDESPTITRYKSCHLHNLMRDLCVRKCKEEDFLNVMEFQDRKQVSDLNSLGGNAYRLAIYGDQDDDNAHNKILGEANKGTRAYSVTNLEPLIAYRVSKYLRNLRFLRMLSFEGVEFSNPKLLHKVIKYLIHLRLLRFQDCKLDEVPSSIAMLPYLQSFILLYPLGNVKVPNVFWKIKTLVHLLLIADQFDSSMEKLRLNCLSRLELLVIRFPMQVKDLSTLANLRYFDSIVRDNQQLSHIISCSDLEIWCKVQHITLSIENDCDFVSRDGRTLLHKLFICRAVQKLNIWKVRIMELPKYDSGMLASSCMVELGLFHTLISEDPMPMLEKLPKLKRLWLMRDSFVGKELICSSTGFPNLISFELKNLINLKQLIIDEGAMPNLSRARIVSCSGLGKIPDGMKFLKVLKKLEIFGMPPEFNNRISIVNGQEGADFDKVRHVPLISIW